LRQNIARRTSESLKAVAQDGRSRIDNVVKSQVSIVQGIGSSREFRGTARALVEELRNRVGSVALGGCITIFVPMRTVSFVEVNGLET
jgi:hypothetical protein